jgi:hypothetical protein
MTTGFDQLAVSGISVDFNPVGGNLWNFVVQADDGSKIKPLHTAPWAHNANTLSNETALVERQLSGDFFCAPFGVVEGVPIHGWTANGHWQRLSALIEQDGTLNHCYQLAEPVFNAVVKKTLILKPNHPFLYQSHQFTGGTGHLPIAHHAMLHVPGGSRLSFSPYQCGVTPKQPPESIPDRGHSMLAYPQVFEQLSAVHTSDKRTIDLTEYPNAEGHEDIVVLAGAKDVETAWSAVLAKRDGFLFLAIKDARKLPETVLWMSNGGRHYAPWESRHTAVLGIEEAATSCHHTHSFGSQARVSPLGLAAGLNLDSKDCHDIRYCFGAVAAPNGWEEIVNVEIESESLIVTDIGGDTLRLPFDSKHFEPSGSI